MKYFLGQKVSGVDQLLCCRLWRVGALLRLVGACCGMSPSTLESYVNYLTFIDFFFFPLTLTNIFSFSFSFSDFYLFIDTFVYHLIFFLNWLVNAAVSCGFVARGCFICPTHLCNYSPF